MKNKKLLKGFTLIELIIVVAVIGLLAAAVFVAVDPAKRIGDANNAQRWSDITAIADAILKYTVDNNGTLPSYIADLTTENPSMIQVVGGIAGGGSANCTNVGILSSTTRIHLNLVSAYLPTVPEDPSPTTATNTDYFIKYNTSSGRIVVGACQTYGTASIYVQR